MVIIKRKDICMFVPGALLGVFMCIASRVVGQHGSAALWLRSTLMTKAISSHASRVSCVRKDAEQVTA
jgi:hypothetical protein